MFEVILARATPAWWADAACRTERARRLVKAGRADFFPAAGRTAGHARDICADCPVRQECAAAAEGDNGRWLRGVWGGRTEGERRRARSN